MINPIDFSLYELNGKYYMTDTTWADVLPDKVGMSLHVEFLKSYSYYTSSANNHSATDYIVQGGINPQVCSDNSYDNCIWNGVCIPFKYIGGTWYSTAPNGSSNNGICSLQL